MYDRTYQGRELQFEASGGLAFASLVMQDKQTDSYWALMLGESVGGELEGTPLRELPIGEKAQWKDWRTAYPHTRVLSIAGVEHVPVNPYADYFQSQQGFRSTQASDSRLPTKEPIFAFRIDDQAFAVPYSRIAGGRSYSIGKRTLFLYRSPQDALFASTHAFVSTQQEGYVQEGGVWHEEPGGATFDPDSGVFSHPARSRPLSGFDTFWYNWSLTNPGTRVLGE